MFLSVRVFTSFLEEDFEVIYISQLFIKCTRIHATLHDQNITSDSAFELHPE